MSTMLVNSGLYRLLSSKDKLTIPPDLDGFYTHKDFEYPTISWSRVNLAIAAQRLDGHIIGPNETFSFIDTVVPYPQFASDSNEDPANGFVFGLQRWPPLAHLAAAGLCKPSTDVFRCALRSPVIIKESHTHVSVNEKHPYFKYYPFGTDDMVYFDENTKLDLVIQNPWSFPIKLQYKLWDTKGNPLDPKRLTNKMTFFDYALGSGVSFADKITQLGISIPKGYIPYITEIPINTTTAFEPLSDTPVNWDCQVEGPVLTNDNQMMLKRRLTINEAVVQEYIRVSGYGK